VLVGCADILERLFDQVLVPGAVRDELLRLNAPEIVKAWIRRPPPWLKVEQIPKVRPIHGLHPGESEALQLALQAKAAGVLMDDLDGRKAARRLGLSVAGTVGLLERAAEAGWIKLPEAVARLRQTNFFIAPEVLNQVLERDRSRRALVRPIAKDPGLPR